MWVGELVVINVRSYEVRDGGMSIVKRETTGERGAARDETLVKTNRDWL